jgi:oligopeptide transport system ATP-binding protein
MSRIHDRDAAEAAAAGSGTRGVEEPLLRVRDLRVEFASSSGRVHAVNGVSFDLQRHELLGIVGESGCGKSVTALAILRLLAKPAGRLTGGDVVFDEMDLLTLDEDEMRDLRGRQVTMIFQDPMTSLNPVTSIGEQLVETVQAHTKLDRKAAQDRAVEALELVGIPNPRARLRDFPHQFSGGMRQRVMIAMALMMGPKLLIADEPTTALDVTIQAQILDLIARAAHETGAAVILITHDLGVVAGMTHRVQVMYAGRIVETAATEELFAHPRHPYTVGLLRSIPRLDTGGTRELIPIEGLPPDLTRLPVGCPFAPRCAWAIERCLAENPLLSLPGSTAPAPQVALGTHLVACWNPATDSEAVAGVPASGNISAVAAAARERQIQAAAALGGES